ncbi:MAG: nucleotide sugar dehydrogenase [Bacteroidales bacterium]|nr:nucleotide sugar dehydrogenase [Bacteroidales bacterium]
MNSDIKIGVIGLGYVGWPLYSLLSKKFITFGLDIDENRINELKNSEQQYGDCVASLTNTYKDLSGCNVFIVCVPTGVNEDKTPNLNPLQRVCKSLGEILAHGSTVVFESTVFPGATEEFCVPLLENSSNLKVNEDFYVGYSPERINVGDDRHSLDNISKIISASNEKTLELMYELYSSIITAPIIKASSIKVAEATKMYENVQRDVLIALANEYSDFCRAEGININEVTECASSKWNFSKVNPGLVGGHCIGIDTYYLLNRANQKSASLSLIQCARTINETTTEKVADKIREIAKGLGSKTILLLGATYKADTADCRNSKALEIFRNLKGDLTVDCYDPLIDVRKVTEEYHLQVLTKSKELLDRYDLVVRLVNHANFNSMNIAYSKFVDLMELL